VTASPASQPLGRDAADLAGMKELPALAESTPGGLA
jgi:hypothetical protein